MHVTFISLVLLKMSVDVVWSFISARLGVFISVGYYRNNLPLLFGITGFHLMVPFLTRVEPIQVTIQTDQVGLLLYFRCGGKGHAVLFL